MKRFRWLIIIGGILLIIVAAGLIYSVYFASTVNPPHTAPGVATTCGTPIPSTALQIFQIVPNQTTASYKVHENLILRNLPSNDAVGTTHSVQGSFRIRTGASPLVADMNVTVNLS